MFRGYPNWHGEDTRRRQKTHVGERGLSLGMFSSTRSTVTMLLGLYSASRVMGVWDNAPTTKTGKYINFTMVTKPRVNGTKLKGICSYLPMPRAVLTQTTTSSTHRVHSGRFLHFGLIFGAYCRD